mgnify:CR=1 FL=1
MKGGSVSKGNGCVGKNGATEADPVNPSHYRRGPVECITVTREIHDFRLASAMKYLWRTSFGGKIGEDEKQDIRKAIWYLQDYLEH